MTARRGSRFEMDPLQLDLTPMIDIVFNLLIFFMCSAKFRTSEGLLHALLPKDQGLLASAKSAPDLTTVRLGLRWHDVGGRPTEGPDGRCVVTIEGSALNAPGELEATARPDQAPVWRSVHERIVALRDAYAGQDPDGLPVIIDARPQVPTQHVISALNELLRAKVQNVTFAAPAID